MSAYGIYHFAWKKMGAEDKITKVRRSSNHNHKVISTEDLQRIFWMEDKDKLIHEATGRTELGGLC